MNYDDEPTRHDHHFIVSQRKLEFSASAQARAAKQQTLRARIAAWLKGGK